VEEYLTITELAARLKLKPKTIKNKMASGIFRRGTHYVSPVGLGPRFKWSAIVEWLEQSEAPVAATPGTEIFHSKKIKGLDIGDELNVKGQYVR
jgi:hypothetical protein